MKNVSLTMCSFVLVQIKRFVLLHELLQLQPHEPYCLTLVEYALCAVRLSTSPCVDVNSCCHTVFRRIFNVRKHDSVRVHMNSCWNSVFRRIFNVRKHDSVRVILWLC